MSTNDNNLNIPTWIIVDNHAAMSQGTLVGIVFAWIFGSILFYIGGILVIWFGCKRLQRSDSQSSESRDKKQSSQERENSKPKRKLYEQNPTLQLVVTNPNQRQQSK